MKNKFKTNFNSNIVLPKSPPRTKPREANSTSKKNLNNKFFIGAKLPLQQSTGLFQSLNSSRQVSPFMSKSNSKYIHVQSKVSSLLRIQKKAIPDEARPSRTKNFSIDLGASPEVNKKKVYIPSSAKLTRINSIDP